MLTFLDSGREDENLWTERHQLLSECNRDLNYSTLNWDRDEFWRIRTSWRFRGQETSSGSVAEFSLPPD
jgi:hypothetical protein